MSTFVSHLTHSLSQKILPPTTTPPSPPGSHARSKETLRELFLRLTHGSSASEAMFGLQTLQTLQIDTDVFTDNDEEEAVLHRGVISRVAVNLYGEALDIVLEDARQVEDELEWWADVERSQTSVALYLLQTTPLRIANLGRTVSVTLRQHNLPLRASLFTPSTLRRLFPSHGVLHPNALTATLFPHLNSQPYSIALSIGRFPSPSAFVSSPGTSVPSAYSALVTTFVGLGRSAAQLISLPLDLTRGECHHKVRELKRLRDERAEMLGTLANMHDLLASALEAPSGYDALVGLTDFSCKMHRVVLNGLSLATPNAPNNVVQYLQAVAVALQSDDPSYSSALRMSELHTCNLVRPSRLTLVWPQLLLLPPLALYAAKTVYASHASMAHMANEALDTVKRFWEQWLLEPLKDVVKTVRAGGEYGVIVSRESVKADLDSLERMALALAQEKLHFDVPQLEVLSRQIQMGDLTPVMQIYEEDIKKPLKSAVAGTLIRTLFIQVQKAKVDIDQAIAGIDKLLKSQELTFAFVGVAPALAIVYAVAGYIRAVWTGGRGKGKYGGKKRRASVWQKMRRIERLLIAQPRSHRTFNSAVPPTSIPPLTAGLLLLSVSHLRAYAERHLPTNSRLREGFLEDVVDLEDPALGRTEKLRVLDRMWRSWGKVLGWETAAVNGQ